MERNWILLTYHRLKGHPLVTILIKIKQKIIKQSDRRIIGWIFTSCCSRKINKKSRFNRLDKKKLSKNRSNRIKLISINHKHNKKSRFLSYLWLPNSKLLVKFNFLKNLSKEIYKFNLFVRRIYCSLKLKRSIWLNLSLVLKLYSRGTAASVFWLILKYKQQFLNSMFILRKSVSVCQDYFKPNQKWLNLTYVKLGFLFWSSPRCRNPRNSVLLRRLVSLKAIANVL